MKFPILERISLQKMYKDTIKDITESTLRAQLRKLEIIKECQLMGFQDGLRKLYKQITYDYAKDHYEDFEMTLFPTINKWYKEKYVKNSKDRYKYAMITVNPYQTTTIEQLLKCYEKAMRKKYIISSISCLEWTKETTDTNNGGLHIHMRIEIDNKDPYRIKREFYNTFNKITEPQCVSIRYSNVEDCFIKYINGYEKKDNKYKPKECMPITHKYRNINNIPATF